MRLTATEPLTADATTIGLVALLCLLVGGLVGWGLASLRRRAADGGDAERLEALVAERNHLAQANAGLRAQVHAQGEQLQRDRATAELASQLRPMHERLTDFGEQLRELERQRSAQHGALATQLQQSLESEERLRQSTDALARALSSTASRGSWGEAQLRRLVELSGMVERVDFDVQAAADGGRMRPDMVVHLPGGGQLAIDAKAPLDAFLQAQHLPQGAEHDAQRAELMAAHAAALKRHITDLAAREYQRGLARSPELVVLFLPNEALLAAALEAQPELLEYSFSKGIALASPVSLFGLLRTVAASWSEAEVSEDAAQILQLATELYDRLATLSGHVDKLRGSLESSVKHFNAFNASLETRVFVTGRKLQNLVPGKEVRQINELTNAPSASTAPEFTERESDAA